MDNIFRAYDIRGVYNVELDPVITARIGLALGTYLGGKGAVTLGRDGRTSSIAVEHALVAGLTSAGIDVVSVGMLPIPTSNYWTWKNDFAAGVYITASHNPAEYNGIRFRHPDGTGYTQGNVDVAKVYEKGEFLRAPWNALGRHYRMDTNLVIRDYLRFILRHVSPNRKKKIAIDPGNGVASLTAPEIFREMGMEIVTINSQVDGTFPGRPSEPNEKTLGDLRKIVLASGADLGIGFDGDADRAVFVDDRGRVVQVEKVAVLIGRELLKRRKGPVITTVSGSMIVKEEIERAGGEVITIRVGDVFVAEAIKKHGAVFAAEDSAHFFIPLDYHFDDPLLMSILLVEMLSGGDATLGELSDSIPFYPKTKGGHRCEDDIKFDVVGDVVRHYQAMGDGGPEVITIDGAKIVYPDGWGLIRCSNTQPKVRITVEAQTPERLRELEDEFTAVFLEKKAGRDASE